MDGRTYGRADGHLRPTLLGQLGGVDLKTGHMTLTTPIRGLSDIRRPVLDIFYMHTKFGDSHFSRSRKMIAGVKIGNGSCDPDHTPFGVECHPKARI